MLEVSDPASDIEQKRADTNIQVVSNHRDVFEALLSAYAKIGAVLPRLDRYGEAFSKNPEIQRVLASIYAAILDFHGRAYKFLRQRGTF